MPNYLEQECPICHRPFQKDDDVVVCPECGAPYHRNCWQSSGQCIFRDKHGTPEQWQPKPSRDDEDTVVCGNCGTVNSKGSDTCSKCGRKLESPENSPRPDNLSVSIAKPNGASKSTAFSHETDTAAADKATFIGRNSEYYLPRFDLIERQNNRFSWNWCAAFFPVEWLLYRKMYKKFVIVFLLMLLISLPSVYIFGLSYQALIGNNDAYETFLSGGQLPAVQAPFFVTILSNAASTLMLLLRGALALTANSLYYTHVSKCVDKIKQGNTDPLYYRYVLSRKGGTNLTGVIFFLAAVFLFLIIGSVLLMLYIIK